MNGRSMIGKETVSVRNFFRGVRYTLRANSQYNWQSPDVFMLVCTLVLNFLRSYKPGHPLEEAGRYPGFCLGTITTCMHEGNSRMKTVLGGHQLLTTVLLVLLYLNRRNDALKEWSDLEDRFTWEDAMARGYNPDSPDYVAAMEALFLGRDLEDGEASKTTRNIMGCYRRMERTFPPAIDSQAWPLFVHWLLDRVFVEEITACNEEAASILRKAQVFDARYAR